MANDKIFFAETVFFVESSDEKKIFNFYFA